MDVIKSGLEEVLAGAEGGCPCICSTGWSGADTIGLEGGTCGFNCGCLYTGFVANANANSLMAYRITHPEQ